jgi:murein DD-endopeptidase MepM/ murein hydrolase activator NlpD
MVYAENRFLNMEEMTVNADYILSFLLDRGWTKNSVSGMLGNMETESTINPGIWQNLDSGNMSMGYGLVQWTPASKYIDWANANSLSYENIDSQLARIEYEIVNGLQWISTGDYPLSFQEFKISTESPEYLAQAFLRNYERPADQTQPNRSTQARYWFDTLTGEGNIGSKPFFPTTEGLPITSPYGWRTHPITGEQDFHGAIDISGQGVNHPIYATQSGIVLTNQWSDSAGWMLVIQHTGDIYYSRYLHLDSQSPISVGTTVTKGQEIGTMGTTGNSTGIHLDFGISKINGGWNTEENTIDPEIYLQMTFGGENPNPPTNSDKNVQMIKMLLADTLNGWRY